MRKNGFNKLIISIIYCVVIFFVALISLSAIMNQGNTDMTSEMGDATFPVISFRYGNYSLSECHGYATEMDTSFMEDHLTPLMAGRKFAFVVDTYGEKVYHMCYELRSKDGTRLLENGDIMDYVQDGDDLIANVTLKDLLEEYAIYSLCIILQTEHNEEIRYYTNVMEADDYPVENKLKFVNTFSDLTFQKADAQNVLPTYLESNASGDNSTFQRVNINSSLKQITWGGLNVMRVTEPVAEIKDIDASIGVIELNYYVTIREEEQEKVYRVNEYFRISEGGERYHLLDYERTMKEIFDHRTGVIANNKIVLGITSNDVEFLESSDGNRIAFAQEGKLYSYNLTDNKLAEIFSFYDTNLQDIRTAYDKNRIRIFQMDEVGNIEFLVYGYMNRGTHEGEMGICIYYYDSVRNMVEEQAFIPDNRSFEYLDYDMQKLVYINNTNQCYLWQKNSFYRIDLDNRDCQLIVGGLKWEDLITSGDSNMTAWLDEEKIIILNMETSKRTVIMPENGCVIKPIGFFGSDLVYGVGRNSDAAPDESGNQIFPMFKIAICGQYGNTLKEYETPGYYIIDTIVSSNMIQLLRVSKTEEGIYEEALPDQIMNNTTRQSTKNYIESVVTDTYETILQVVLRKNIPVEEMQILTPRFVLHENNYEVLLSGGTERTDQFYVYGKGRYMGYYSESEKAVSLAFENRGSVYDYRGQRIYHYEMLPKENQIMAISGMQVEADEGNSAKRAVCINAILQYNGIIADTRADMIMGKSVQETLQQYFSEKETGNEAISLYGCPLQSALYFVANDIPVMVELENGSALLLVGYNEYNTIVMDPSTGTVYKIGINDSTELYQDSGNRFTTYY